MGAVDDLEGEHTDEGDFNHNEGTTCGIADLEGSRRGELARPGSVDEAVEGSTDEEDEEESF